MHPSLKFNARNIRGALVCAAAIAAAGCHNPNYNSGYGIALVTLTSDPGGTSGLVATPGDFASYVVTIDSVTLTRNDGAIVTAVGTPESVDLTLLKNISELWNAAGSIADGTYLSASITLDYTNAAISVYVNGVPTKATVVDKTGAPVTTLTENVTLDPAYPLNSVSTFATTSAVPLAIDFDLAASGWVNMAGSVPVVTVNPFFTAAVIPADTNLIRVRGSLVNTSAPLGTYSIYVRPFFDEQSSLGTLTLFGNANTIYSINGTIYTGNSGVTTLSNLSAGYTTTAAYTTFTPDYNPPNLAYAGTYNTVYMIGGSTLEDTYTVGLSGDVIARNGNTLTLRGSTLFYNAYYSTPTGFLNSYEDTDSILLVGPKTLVSADDTTLTGLNADSIAVGQHIEARGIYGLLGTGQVQLDATGTTSANTGSVRLESSQLWGPLVSSAAGSLTMNVQAINDLPISVFNFSGNGASAGQTPAAGSFTVNTGSLTLPADAKAGSNLWVNGLVTAFGSAPPDFKAGAVNTESSVQLGGGAAVPGGNSAPAGAQWCGLTSQVCEPASLRVLYAYGTGTSTPFVSPLTNAGFTVDLANPQLVSAVIRIGPENIDLKSLPASPQVVPTTSPITTTFAPRYAFGNPTTSTVTPAIPTATTSINVFNSFPSFVTALNGAVSATNTVLQFDARGVYDRTTNVFTATTVNVVL